MISTKNYNNNSSIYVNTRTFDNILINGVIKNYSLTTNINTISSNINTISSNINTISSNINTISGSLNNLTNYKTTTISGDVNLICNKFSYNDLTVF